MTLQEELKEATRELQRCLARVAHAQATVEKWPDSEGSRAYLVKAQGLWLDADDEHRALSERYRAELSVA